MDPPLTDTPATTRRRFTLELSLEKLAHIDALKKEWGLRNRGDVLERLLEELFASGEEGLLAASPVAASEPDVPPMVDDSLDDNAALVLVGLGEGAMEAWLGSRSRFVCKLRLSC